jgi:ABC-type bacteriocin/lantibiotic exporter with double-glycine peptidase domain
LSKTILKKGALRTGFLFLFLLTGHFLFSCAGPLSVKESPTARLIEKVPFYPQEEYQCGPASMAGVLNYWGLKVSPEEVAAEIFSPKARGTLDMDMVFYAERKGMKVGQYRGSLEDLRGNIDSGHPLVVLVDEGFWVYQKGHYLVVIGYDQNGFIVNSGKDRHKWVSRDHFLRTWERTKFWTLRITPK